jgi:hypothetical protein
VVEAPVEFDHHLRELEPSVVVDVEPAAGTSYDFAIAFVRSTADVSRLVPAIVPRIGTNPGLWFAYPKKSSPRYRSDLTRDAGWQSLGAFGFEPVRQVAIDENWSALRFRHVSLIDSVRRTLEGS